MADSILSKKVTVSTANLSIGKNVTEKTKKMILVILLLLVCCLCSAYLFRKTLDRIDANSNLTVAPSLGSEVGTIKEIEDVQKMGVNVGMMDRTERSVMQTALLAEASGVFPIASETTLDQIAVDSSIAENPIVSDVPEVVPEPPAVTVVAIMIVGKERVAMLDVAEEEKSLIVRQGSKFSNGTATIKKIDSKGVTFTWMKKNYEALIQKW